MVLTRGGVRRGRRPVRLDKRATHTVVRDSGDGRRRIAAVQKTAHRRPAEAVSFRMRPATRPRA
ncbi:hypothetical protein [Streptomyces sp. NPDC093094]|uniref:hypothetical protein n=1 Tax=Streptomyces sp. NPDC093094 TaxID=3366026 RepID=UPI0037F48E86